MKSKEQNDLLLMHLLVFPLRSRVAKSKMVHSIRQLAVENDCERTQEEEDELGRVSLGPGSGNSRREIQLALREILTTEEVYIKVREYSVESF